MNWRAIASELGMFVSDSTHMPPTGTKRPAATCSEMRRNRLGYSSRIHWNCWAEEQEKTSWG